MPEGGHQAAAAFIDGEPADLTPADLMMAIGLMNAYNRLAISFRTVPAAARA